MIVEGHIPTGKKILRTVESERPCPWCWQANLTFIVKVRSFVMKCPKKCGYEATMTLAEMTKEEKKICYPKARKENDGETIPHGEEGHQCVEECKEKSL